MQISCFPKMLEARILDKNNQSRKVNSLYVGVSSLKWHRLYESVDFIRK